MERISRIMLGLIIVLFTCVIGLKVHGFEYHQFTMPQYTTEDMKGHQFAYGKRQGDGRYTVYHDGTTRIKGHVYFQKITYTENNVTEYVTETHKDVCSIAPQAESMYNETATLFCSGVMINSCGDVNHKIEVLNKMIQQLSRSKTNRVVSDKRYRIHNNPLEKEIEVAIYVPASVIEKTKYIVKHVEKIRYMLPKTGASL